MKVRRKDLLKFFLAEFLVLIITALLIFSRIPDTSTFSEIKRHKIKSFRLKFEISKETTRFKRLMYNTVDTSITQYIESCLGSDYYHPESGDCSNHSGLGITAISSLDTLYIMENHKLYKKLRKWTEKSFTCKQNRFLHTKDLFIHIIGGLISIYTLTGDEMYLNKLDECAEIASHAFSRPIPFPLVHGELPLTKQYNFIQGTYLGDSGSFLLESKALSLFLNQEKFKGYINSYLEYVRRYVNNGFPMILSQNSNLMTESSRISSFSASFYANLIRSYIYEKTEIEEILIDSFLDNFRHYALHNITGFSNENENQFESDICQLVPLLRYINKSKEDFYQKIHVQCYKMGNDTLPLTREPVKYYSFDTFETPFNFDSSLLEDHLLKNQSFEELLLTRYIDDPIRNGVFCNLESQEKIKYEDFMPPEAISKWAKLLFLDGTPVSYNNFVFNEAGHFIPKSF